MKNIISIVVLVAVVAVVGIVAGCGSQEAKKPPDEVTVQLKWIHQAQFAGLYAAGQKGFYAEENIEVTLKPGGSDISGDQAFNDLIAGETAFTIQGGDQVIAARAQG